MLVDDDASALRLLNRQIAAFGLEADQAQDGMEAMELLHNRPYGVVITDLLMPKMNGIELLQNITKHQPFTDVLVISGQDKSHCFSHIMEAGASDFIEKPFTLDELKTKLQRIFRERRLVNDLQQAKEQEKRSFLGLVESLAISLSEKDLYTHGHSKRVTDLSLQLAHQLSDVDVDLELLRLCGMLHDIGKIGVPDNILAKPAALSTAEFGIIKNHPDRGAHILQPIAGDAKGLTISKVIRHHHERFDGNGYPSGIKGENIPLMSRIIAIADSYDAMTSDRPYRKSLTRGQALAEIQKNAGTQFDPALVTKFISSMHNPA
ncbi:MAG: response regulator [Desulfobulbaceae bacterium]|nr:response regulator [Desulfobulbaceae bacterium]